MANDFRISTDALEGQADGPAAAPAVSRLHKICLAVILVVFFLLAGAYNAVTPAATSEQYNPDENGHMYNVRTIASGHVPVFDINVSAMYEAHQPPLYYALCAPVYLASRARGEAIATRAVRWVSTVIIAVAVVFAFLTVLIVLPELPWVAVGVAMFIAWLPGVVGLAASVSNDFLTFLMTVLCLWSLARASVTATAGDSAINRNAVVTGVILGAAVNTKMLLLPLFPTVFMFYLLLAYRKGLAEKAMLRAMVISCGIGLLIGLPWFARNTLLYGDPLTQKLLMVTLNDNVHNTKVDVIAGIVGGFWNYLAVDLKWAFASYWYQMDHMSLFWNDDPLRVHRHSVPVTHNPGPLYALCAALSVLSIPGVFLALRRAASDTPRLVWLWTSLVLIALTAYAFLRYNLVFFQCQGRYWYPALLPFTLFFILGWRSLLPSPRLAAVFLGALTLGLLALNAYTLFGLLIPRYAQL